MCLNFRIRAHFFMSELDKKIDSLHSRLNDLKKREAQFRREILALQNEINSLKFGSQTDRPKPFTKKSPKADTSKAGDGQKKRKVPPSEHQKAPVSVPNFARSSRSPKLEKSNIEKFVGTYLISIIGILITIVGVGIGAKYAIDNDLISPLGRIVFGYAVGFGLIGFAVRLKQKYLTFSSVLLSGGMAVMYFVTYFAYSYYSLISQTTAFSLMVIFTVFTVLSALIYDRRVIAHIGLVGAYGVPFLLSDGSGRVDILFGYMAIINIGILAISVYKYWKYLFYSSFAFTWLIYAVWYFEKYDNETHFGVGLFFLFVFFAIFYATFLAYKLIHKKPLNFENTALILQNSALFFGFGYSILNGSSWDRLLGSFALLNALIHFAVAALISRYKLGDRNAFYLVIALVLTFATIAVPIQFDGHWITILWIAEAAFLFLIGRTRRIPLYEYFSYPVMMIAGLSLLNDWWYVYFEWLTLRPLSNWLFVTSLSVVAGLALIYVVNRDKRYKPQVENSLYQLISLAVPGALLLVLYNTFRMEIGHFFWHESTAPKGNSNFLLNIVWQINYTLFFLAVLSLSNIRYFRDAVLAALNLVLNAVAVFIFLTLGLSIIRELRSEILFSIYEFGRLPGHCVLRYISIGLLASVLFSCYLYIRQEFLTKAISSKGLRFCLISACLSPS